MKCPYKKHITKEVKDYDGSCEVLIHFGSCDMTECPFWDTEIGVTGSCKKAYSETNGYFDAMLELAKSSDK